MSNTRNIAAALTAAFITLLSSAQAQPASGPVSLIVPSPPGNALDVGARQIQPELGKLLQRPVVVENVAGVSGSIGAQRMLNAPASASAMVVGSTNEFVLPSLTLKSVNLKASDFRMVGQLSNGVVAVLARPDFPANNLTELVALLKKKKSGPDVTYGSMGPGSITHLIGVDLASRLGAEMTHVPYKGSSLAVQDLMGSMIDLTFLPLITTYAQMASSGKLKILGVMSSERHAVVKTAQPVDEVAELKGFHYKFWVGVFMASNLPIENAAAANKAINQIVSSPAYANWNVERGAQNGEVMSLDQAKVFFESETKRMERLVKTAGIVRE